MPNPLVTILEAPDPYVPHGVLTRTLANFAAVLAMKAPPSQRQGHGPLLLAARLAPAPAQEAQRMPSDARAALERRQVERLLEVCERAASVASVEAGHPANLEDLEWELSGAPLPYGPELSVLHEVVQQLGQAHTYKGWRPEEASLYLVAAFAWLERSLGDRAWEAAGSAMLGAALMDVDEPGPESRDLFARVEHWLAHPQLPRFALDASPVPVEHDAAPLPPLPKCCPKCQTPLDADGDFALVERQLLVRKVLRFQGEELLVDGDDYRTEDASPTEQRVEVHCHNGPTKNALCHSWEVTPEQYKQLVQYVFDH